MARSIKIHRDLYGFERTHKGLTNRQLIAMAIAIVIAIAISFLLAYVLEIDISIAVPLAIVFAAPVLVSGFSPIWGLPAEVWLAKLTEMKDRGDVIGYQTTIIMPELQKGTTNREYRKKKKKQGYECNCSDLNGIEAIEEV